VSPTPEPHPGPLTAGRAAEGSFLAELVRLHRNMPGARAGATDFELLEPFVITREKRRRLEAGGEPDPEVFWRIELFHDAVGLAIERRTGVACTPLLKMHHEGYGRVVLVAGRLVVLSRFVRDVRRFGFDSVGAIAEAGEKLVSEGVEMIQSYPEVARWEPRQEAP
jgi:probable nitrogen fixation protein